MDLENRMANAERSLTDHARIFTEYNGKLQTIMTWIATQDIAAAREEERDKAAERRIHELEEQIKEVREESRAGFKEIKGAVSRVQWIIIGAVITVAIGYIGTRLGLAS